MFLKGEMFDLTERMLRISVCHFPHACCARCFIHSVSHYGASRRVTARQRRVYHEPARVSTRLYRVSEALQATPLSAVFVVFRATHHSKLMWLAFTN
jgi:hypothetical protein